MIVIDSSVAFKWFSTDREEDVAKARKLLGDHINNQETIIVPDLIIYELANAWATKSALTEERIQIHLNDLKDIKLSLQSFNFVLIQKAIEFSKKYHVSVYDSLYAVLAQMKGCKLITADNKFTDKIDSSFVIKLSEYE